MPTKNFDHTKAQILADLGVVDYSPKGSVDHEIVPLINIVNNNRDLVTTSSCAGRVSIFIEGDKSGEKLKVGGKGLGGHWLFFTHNPAELVPQWRKGLHDYEHVCNVSEGTPRRYVLYKFEPFILHVKCRDHATARALFSLAVSCGFRETGIGSNDNVAIRISMRIDAPIGYLEGTKIHHLANAEYLAELDAMALELFAKNNQRINQLANALKRFETPLSPKRETRQERARRKREDGLQIKERSARDTQVSQSSSETTQLDELSSLLTESFEN